MHVIIVVMPSSSVFTSYYTLVRDVVMTVPKTVETSSLRTKQVDDACFTLYSLQVLCCMSSTVVLLLVT